MTPELKPCPFCGGPADYTGREGAGYTVACGHCGASSGWGDYGYQVQAKWNARAALAAHDAAVQCRCEGVAFIAYTAQGRTCQKCGLPRPLPEVAPVQGEEPGQRAWEAFMAGHSKPVVAEQWNWQNKAAWAAVETALSAKEGEPEAVYKAIRTAGGKS